jgi:flagellar hook-basal body complex protein FliE
MPTPGIAANAYAQLARITANDGSVLRSIGDASPDRGPSFTALLREAMEGVGTAGQKADAQAQALATGKASVVDVATAVAEAETAVSALVAVRDSVIQSYQQIMSMAI